jgi:hypothetical protein
VRGVTKYYGLQTDRALVQKYGTCWWRRVRHPAKLARRVEQRIYQLRKRRADRLVPLAVAFTVSLIINTGIAIWRITH